MAGPFAMVTGGFVLLLWSVTCVWSAPVHIYVSPSGDDANTGLSSEHPVKTLHHAVDMLGQHGVRGNTVFVELMQGYHDLSSTLHIQSTSGTVVFRAYQGQEVHVTGGKRLPSDQFHHVTDPQVRQRLPEVARDKVLELDLTAAGVTDLGKLRPFGFNHSGWNAPLEVFINGKPLVIAEWPNYSFINIKAVTAHGHHPKFTFNAHGRDVSWAQETEPWVYGWWFWSWADLSLPVSGIDPHTHTITLGGQTRWGIRPGHYDPSSDNRNKPFQYQGGYFRVINMLCEIDLPGEYFVDRHNKKLYVWPNTPQQTLTSSDFVYASLIDDCFVVESNATQVHFEDFSLEACRHRGFLLQSARNITFRNMEIKNTGGTGVLAGGDSRGVSVLASDIHDVGGGVNLRGGKRTNLTRSENLLRDCHIWNHARYGAQPNFAVVLSGVGATISHSHLHHGQYSAIWWSGNEHTIEYNHIHHECMNSSDCGAVHSGREWTWRGNVIRHNHIHDVRRFYPGSEVRGIMLDDQYSSVLIEHNVFYHNEVHTNIGGGRDNVIRYNVMYKADSASVACDGRGMQKRHNEKTLYERLEKSPYRTDLWKARYPQLFDIKDHNPPAPLGNQIYQNVFYNKPGVPSVHYSDGTYHQKYYDVHDNHRAFYESEFWSPNLADFRLNCEAAQWSQDQHVPRPLTLDEVGPTVPTGPSYLRVQRHPTPAPKAASKPLCTHSTMAPAKVTPRVAYMPDGSANNTLYPDVPKEGCWLVVEHCQNKTYPEGRHKDAAGTQNGTEEGCFVRAAQLRQECGASNSKIVAVYGPTGAMTFSARGCYVAEYGCGHFERGHIGHDSYAENHEHGLTSERSCLSRAAATWIYCGRHRDLPQTRIYGPTGKFVTAGAGCWVKVRSCPDHPDLEGFFFDAWGDTNRATGLEKDECFQRATDYWKQCGSHSNATVTAYFRPTASEHTVP